MSQALRLGSLTLEGLEAPEDIVFPTEKELAVHRFRGGKKTIQSFGTFAPDVISWRGVLLGESAQSRSQNFQALSRDEREITLAWGHWHFRGTIKSFKPNVKNEWWIEYEIEFAATVDDSQPSGTDVRTPESTIKEAFIQASDRINEPPSNVQFDDITVKTFNGLQKSLQEFIDGSGGRLSLVPLNVRLDLQTQVQNLIKVFVPLKQIGTSSVPNSTFVPSVSYSASEVISFLQIAERLLSADPPTYQLVRVSNPNMYALASQYYGDASKWDVIALANKKANEPLDPMPIGLFELKIPLNGAI